MYDPTQPVPDPPPSRRLPPATPQPDTFIHDRGGRQFICMPGTSLRSFEILKSFRTIKRIELSTQKRFKRRTDGGNDKNKAAGVFFIAISRQVAWLRVDTQTILTIHNHVITKNHRIGVTHIELKTWHLHIRDVQESDKGWYMCQINTDPMKSQVGYLDVVEIPLSVPPDILDYPTSADMVVDESSDVTLRCVASGSPEPTVTWKREDGELITLPNETEVANITGEKLTLTKVKRDYMGTYLCIASNGVPPSVSKRISLLIQCKYIVLIVPRNKGDLSPAAHKYDGVETATSTP
ncbi:hypothetical protein GWI33_015806 [Rhynchophorus ferrugineus]|uniref:Ig-like domain-containing protein n=1 Tax=Rhynchophorus ferrugineus TaxID=354439 RepID=A0A834I246_RHYFE|nr:hypothetical protein GWI33_015806 [Rhynchophorus ferrugineus]